MYCLQQAVQTEIAPCLVIIGSSKVHSWISRVYYIIFLTRSSN
jgi:hypothetical protein